MTVTCLIAEADPFLASLLLRFADESGLRSARARTAQELLPLIEQVRPQVLIVDPQLPGEPRGWEVMQGLRASGAIAATAVVSCSWLRKNEACQLIGDVVWHLQKPDLYYDDFVRAIEAADLSCENRSGTA